ncbi:hypothetical protein D3C87_1245810 [compost metagenome]
MEEVRCARHHHHGNRARPRPIHRFGQRHDFVFFAVDHQRVVRHLYFMRLKAIDRRPHQHQRGRQRRIARFGKRGIGLRGDGGAERKARQHPGRIGQFGMQLTHLRHHRQHVLRFAHRLVERAFRLPHPTEVGAHRHQAMLHAGARHGRDDLVFARTALQGMRVQDQGPASRRAGRPIDGAIDAAGGAGEGVGISACGHGSTQRA